MRFPLSKGQKILMLLIALLPMIFFVTYFFMFFDMMFSRSQELFRSPENGFFPPFMWRLMIPMGLAAISQLLVLILYLLHAMKNPRLKEGNDRLVWILVLLFANFIGAVIYWWLQIWQDKEKNFQDAYTN